MIDLQNTARRWQSVTVTKGQLVVARTLNAARRWRSWKATKRDLVVASTRHHRARLLKYYLRPPCAPNFVKSRMLRPLQTHFLLFHQIFFVLVYIRAGNTRVPPGVLTSGPKPCGGNNCEDGGLSRKNKYFPFISSQFLLVRCEKSS